MIPAWLSNGELGLQCAEGSERFMDLAYTARSASKWLDENRIEGMPDNHEIAKRALQLFTSLADTSLLVPPVGAVLEPIRQATIRLKGLVK